MSYLSETQFAAQMANGIITAESAAKMGIPIEIVAASAAEGLSAPTKAGYKFRLNQQFAGLDIVVLSKNAIAAGESIKGEMLYKRVKNAAGDQVTTNTGSGLVLA